VAKTTCCRVKASPTAARKWSRTLTHESFMTSLCPLRFGRIPVSILLILTGQAAVFNLCRTVPGSLSKAAVGSRRTRCRLKDGGGETARNVCNGYVNLDVRSPRFHVRLLALHGRCIVRLTRSGNWVGEPPSASQEGACRALGL
jgi:hypothetical protein